MANLVYDGDFTIASPVGSRRWIAPFFDNRLYVFERDFMQRLDKWEALELDTQDSEEPDFFLVAETQPQDLGGGIGRWTRTYARLPEQRSNYETHNFRYPGIETLTFTIGGITTVLTAGREPFNQTVISRVQFDYYHPGFQPGISSAKDIPIVEGFAVWSSQGRGFPADYLTTATVPTIADYWQRSRNYTNSPAISPFSYPTLVAVQSTHELVAEDSRVNVWLGNFYERVTRYLPVL